MKADSHDRAPVDAQAFPAAVVNKLRKFGVELSASGAKWPVKLLDGYLSRQGVKLEDRLEVKSLLREVGGLE
jgi:hypothetical protein